MKRGTLHHDSADLHRVEHRVRVECASAPTCTRIQSFVSAISARIFAQSPAWLAPAHEGKLILEREVVDFYDTAIDGEVERAANFVFDTVCPCKYIFESFAPLAIGRYWYPPLSELLEKIPLRSERQCAVDARDGVSKKPQGAPRGDCGVELAQRAGGSIPRIREHRLTHSHARLIHFFEPVERHVYLAAYLDPSAWHITMEVEWHVAHSPKIFGDDLTDAPVAPRCSDDEHAVVVSKAHGCAIDLELGV